MFFTPPTPKEILTEGFRRFFKKVDGQVERFLSFLEKFLTGNL